MNDKNKKQPDSLLALSVKWSARILGSLIILYGLFIIVSSIMEKDNRNVSFSPHAWDGLMIITGTCFLLGITGLIVGFILEGEGGLIALIGMASFLILTWNNPNANFSFYYIILLLPALLYIWYWLIEGKRSE